jgi:nucleoid-associated protein YgaU
MSRFRNRSTIKNDNDLYVEILEERDVKYISHYETPNFRYPTPKEIGDLVIQEHIWKKGDRYFKLAHEYYGEPKLWWVIAWYNKKPTESHANLGDIIYIPTPIGKIMKYLRNE